MSAEDHRITFGQRSIKYEILHRERKTLEIAVEPDGRVAVSAPTNATLKDVADKVRKRARWVLRQQAYFDQFSPRTPERQFIPGETHRYLGRHYRLKVKRGVPGAKLLNGFLVVQSTSPEEPTVTRKLVYQWYRERAHAKFAERLEVNLLQFPNPKRFRPRGLIIRHLRLRWGSMSAGNRLLLNSRLIEAPTSAIDYVITHELAHIAISDHSPRFFKLLDRVMPGWQTRKQLLERFMA